MNNNTTCDVICDVHVHVYVHVQLCTCTCTVYVAILHVQCMSRYYEIPIKTETKRYDYRTTFNECRLSPNHDMCTCCNVCMLSLLKW